MFDRRRLLGGAVAWPLAALALLRERMRHVLDVCPGVLAKRIAIYWTSDRFSIVIIAIWPFLFLWPYTLHVLSIGNDFLLTQYNYKAYLLVALSSWHFPLWSPTELAGYPFFSNPLAQAVYPLNLLYVAFYAVTGSFSVWHYTLFTIMGIGIFGVGLYCWLRRLVFPGYVALVATMIACMSLKVTEIIRYPNAVHSAAWLPWLLLGITMAAARKDVVRGAVTFGIAALMLLTAGYPYYVIYAPFLIGPYFIAMLFAPARKALLGLPPKEQTGSVRYFVSIAVAFAIAAAIALPWLLHVIALLNQTSERATPNFASATEYKFDLVSTVGSWIYPPAASMEGWYYFGMPAALLIVTYLFCLAIRSFGFERHRGIALWIVGWLAVVTYFTWGANSALFRFVWHHVPVLDQMRAWPRLNIVLVPAIACLFALAFSFFVSVVRSARERWTRETTVFIAICATLTMLVLAIQIFMIRNHITNSYWQDYYACPRCEPGVARWPQSLLAHRLPSRFFPVMTVLAGIGVLVAVLLARRWRRSNRAKALAAMIWTLSIFGLFYIFNTQWPRWPIDLDGSVGRDAFAGRFFPVMTVLAATGVLVAVLLARRWRRSNWAKALAAMTWTLSILDLFYISNTQWPRRPIDLDVSVGRDAFASLVSFAEPRRLDFGLADPFDGHHGVGLNNGWGFIRHEQFYLQYFVAYNGLARRGVPQDQVAAARRFFGVDQSGKRLFLTSRIDYTTPVDFMADVDASVASGDATIEIAFFDGDTLRLNVSTQRAAWLSYIDNWDANWTATVDGRDVVIERLFGSYKSVRVPRGRSTVVFSYRPGLFPSVAK
jgi:hypothetical protein